MHNRRLFYATIKETAYVGPLPQAPLNTFPMLTDYIAPEQRSVGLSQPGCGLRSRIHGARYFAGRRAGAGLRDTVLGLWNPRYGPVGMLILPYTIMFEGIGPLLEVTGFVVTTLAALLGILSWSNYRVLLAASILFVAVTMLAVLLSDVSARRYLRTRDLALLCAAALLENVGYRQINSWWGCVGTIQAIAAGGGWGPMKRRAFRT